MEEAIKKADVLIEALPYIKAFHNKITVIKYGGSILGEERVCKGVLEDIVFLSYMGLCPVLVHGGGPNISERLRKIGKTYEGQRNFDAALETYAEAESSLQERPTKSIPAWWRAWIQLQLERLWVYYWTDAWQESRSLTENFPAPLFSMMRKADRVATARSASPSLSKSTSSAPVVLSSQSTRAAFEISTRVPSGLCRNKRLGNPPGWQR